MRNRIAGLITLSAFAVSSRRARSAPPCLSRIHHRSRPLNIDTIKDSLRDYHDTQYAQDMAAAYTIVQKYVEKRAAEVKTRRSSWTSMRPFCRIGATLLPTISDFSDTAIATSSERPLRLRRLDLAVRGYGFSSGARFFQRCEGQRRRHHLHHQSVGQTKTSDPVESRSCWLRGMDKAGHAFGQR